ncbi:MAG TPA: hypothetical protein DCL35_01150 [Candidatus Omnitrophica bacterium]|nr:hypothetical protein [Candidatus Omnitrophota bacterium]
MKRADVLPIFFIIFIVCVASAPLFKNITNINGDMDLLQNLSLDRSFVLSVRQFRQFPLRSFYFGGGYPLVAHPHDGSLSPLILLSLLFGEVVGLKLKIFFYYLTGALGMYYLARRVLNYNNLGAVFSSITFFLGGFLYRITLVRTYTKIDYFLLPLLFAFFLRSRQDRMYLFSASAVMTLLFMQAGPDSIVILLFLFLFALIEPLGFKDNRLSFDCTYLKNLFFICCLVFLLGAVKLLPMLELLQANPRNIGEYTELKQPFNFLALLKNSFCVRYPAYDIFKRGVYFPFYLGYFPVALVVFSLVAFWSKNRHYGILLVLFLILGLGVNAPVDIFKMFWHLPLFNSIDRPFRYFFHIAVFLAALLGGGSFFIVGKIKRPKIAAVAVLFGFLAVVATTADLLWANGVWHMDVFPLKPIAENAQRPFYQIKNLKPKRSFLPGHLRAKGIFPQRSWEWTWPSQYELMLNNIGKINWYGNLPLAESAEPRYYLDSDDESAKKDSLGLSEYTWYPNPRYKGEVYFLEGGKNTADLEYFSPNKIVVKAGVIEPGTLVINQNYDKYWKADKGDIIDQDGLLALRLSSRGGYNITFVYRHKAFFFGLVVSFASMLSMVIMALRMRKNR